MPLRKMFSVPPSLCGNVFSVTRSRTFDWDEPTAFWHRAEGKSGLELLRMAIAGEFPQPPMARLMDIRLIQVDAGHAVFTGTPQEFHYNPLGTVHGGFGATLLDSAMGCAVHTTLAPGDVYTTLEFKINFIRALTHDKGEVRGIGTRDQRRHGRRRWPKGESRIARASSTRLPRPPA